MDYQTLITESQKTEEEKLSEQDEKTKVALFNLALDKERELWLKQHLTLELIKNLTTLRNDTIKKAVAEVKKASNEIACSHLIEVRILDLILDQYIYA